MSQFQHLVRPIESAGPGARETSAGNRPSIPRPFQRCATALRRPLAGAALGVAMAFAMPMPTVVAAESGEDLSVQMEQTQSTSVNINTASVDELADGLTGVGGSKAEAIVRYREQFGPFESIEELAEVTGIGNSTVERNRERIRLR